MALISTPPSSSATPTTHASTHASGGSDAVTLAESQVTNLTTDLAAKAPLVSPTFTGTPAAPTAVGGTNTTQLATTAFVTTAVAGVTAGSATLAGDTDVTITSVANLDAIMYDSGTSKYVNKVGLGVMTAAGDLLVGAPSGNVNQATVAQGASASASTTFGGSSATNAIDVDDSTEWNSSSNGSSTDWIKVDLGSAKAIGVYRIKCAAGTLPSNAKLQSSTDNSTWTDRVSAPIPSLADTGQVTLGSVITAQYWRILLGAITDFPRIRSFELSTLGAAAGTVSKLAKGTTGQAPGVNSAGTLVWQDTLKKLASNTVGTSQVTVAHSLSYTPAICIITMTSTGMIWRSAASDGTSIFLTADAAGRTCDVYVR